MSGGSWSYLYSKEIDDLMKYSTATYLEVLTAQQSLLNAQMSQLQCELQVRQAAISLYQALGGGR